MPKKGAPSKKKREYKEKLADLLSIDHRCYKVLYDATSNYELESLFISELANRAMIIKSYQDDGINFYEFENFIEANTIELSIEYANYYLDILVKLNSFMQMNGGKIKNTVSFKEALGISPSNSRVIENLKNIFKHFDAALVPKGFLPILEVYSIDGIFENCQNQIELFENIKNDLFEYVKNNEEIYREFLIKEFRDVNVNGYNRSEREYYEREYIDDYLEDEIFDDFNKTIKFLKEAKIYDKYEYEIEELILSTNTVLNLKHKVLEKDIAKYHYPNKLAKVEFNFNLPLKSLQEQLEDIYNELHKPNNSYFNWLKDYKILSNNFFKYGKKDKIRTVTTDKLEKNKISLISKLFIFDSKILSADENMIEEKFSEKFGDLNSVTIKDSKKTDEISGYPSLDETVKRFNDYKGKTIRLWVTNKSEYFDEIKELIENKEYIQLATGVERFI